MFSHQAMLESHDEVLKNTTTGEEVNPYQPENTTTFSSRLDDSVGDRPEKLTRVRLVQFHKNPNEPMVSQCAHALRAYLSPTRVSQKLQDQAFTDGVIIFR